MQKQRNLVWELMPRFRVFVERYEEEAEEKLEELIAAKEPNALSQSH